MSGVVGVCFRCERPLTRADYEKLLGETYYRRCAGYHNKFICRDPWPDRKVNWLLPSLDEVNRLADELDRTISEAKGRETNPDLSRAEPQLVGTTLSLRRWKMGLSSSEAWK